MAAVAPEWLGASLESIKAAVEYARQRGIAGEGRQCAAEDAWLSALPSAVPIASNFLPAVLAHASAELRSRATVALAAGGALVRLLEENPKLLAFSVSADGKVLEKGKARASVDLAERNGRQVMGVSYWRTGASFESAPVAPYKPSAL